MAPIDYVQTAFAQSATLTVMGLVRPSVQITNPDFEPNLQDDEFLVVLNLYKRQSATIEGLTKGMTDEDACSYVRDETNRALVDMAEAGSFYVRVDRGPFGQAIPSINIDRVMCLPEPTGRRRFIGVAKGTIIT